MRTYMIILIVVAIVSLILGIITQLVGHAFLLNLSAKAFNDFAETLLVLAVALGFWDFLKKE